MAVCNAQDLLNEAKCLECQLAPGMLPYVEIQLLINMLLQVNPTADVTPEHLMEQAKCWQCKVSPGMAPYVIAQLLCDLLNA